MSTKSALRVVRFLLALLVLVLMQGLILMLIWNIMVATPPDSIKLQHIPKLSYGDAVGNILAIMAIGVVLLAPHSLALLIWRGRT